MARTRPTTERVAQKGRTRSALLAAAVQLVSSGAQPSVADVADAASVSRRTAYRYFPTQEQMLVEAALEGVRSLMTEAIEQPDGALGDEAGAQARLDRTVRAMQRSAAANETLLRTMIHLTVKYSPNSSPTKAGAPRRGYRRIEWLALALQPVRKKLGGKRYERLLSALAVCVGIEALIVLQDIRGLSEREAQEVSRWSARALLLQSLGESDSRRRGSE